MVGFTRRLSLKWWIILVCLRNFNYGICCFEFSALQFHWLLSRWDASVLERSSDSNGPKCFLWILGVGKAFEQLYKCNRVSAVIIENDIIFASGSTNGQLVRLSRDAKEDDWERRMTKGLSPLDWTYCISL